MTDKEVIEQFYTEISWKDECEEIEYGNRLLLKTDVTIKVPTYYGVYGDGVDLAIALASKFQVKPYLLLWGNAPKEMVEGIWWDSHKKTPHVYISWISPYHNQMFWSNDMTFKALDGIDWQRSIEGLAKGSKKPVWSWDK
jgi:hypothetical protein